MAVTDIAGPTGRPLRLTTGEAVEEPVAAATHDPRLIAFLREQHDPLVRLLGFYVGDAHAAEDLAQEALARTVRKWSHVATLDAPHLWVRRVAINLANSHYRRALARRRAMHRVEARAGGAPAVAVSHDDAAAVAVRAAVAALPAPMRTALVLRYFDDRSVADTAQLLGCPEGTVKALTSRAIAKLRDAGLTDAEDPADG